jgi:uncharacterized RDD family membrane protein YckC
MPPPPPQPGQVPPPPPSAPAPPPPPGSPRPPPPPSQPTSAPAQPAADIAPPAPPAATSPTGAQDADDLADILAQLEDEPVPATAAPNRSETPHDNGIAGASTQPTDPAPGVGARLTDPRDLARPGMASEIVIESEGGLDFDPSFATFGKRAIELIVDMAILGVALLPGLVIAAIAGSLWVVGLLVSLIGFVVFVVLAARSIAASGQWVGNRVAGTRIVDGINGSNIDVGRAALRVTVRHLISMIFFFGFLIAFADGQRRTFHDRLSQTVVVGREREVWTADQQTS